MMTIEDLPLGHAPQALAPPHFPTRQQAVVWRNWNLVPIERIAAILQTSPGSIQELAAGMGLAGDARNCDLWNKRGYMTLIRRNWHLLPYEQLLELLDWTPEQMAFALKEDDFLWHKLGKLKPQVAPVLYAPLSQAQRRETEKIACTLSQHFPDANASGEQPFEFLRQYGTGEPAHPTPASRFGMKLAYSYSAACGDVLLDETFDPYPDGLLAQYAAAGINAVWLRGALYTLVPWLGESHYSAHWQQRIETLRSLCARMAGYGIKLYLYLNEPGCMPQEFFALHPDWKGAVSKDGHGALCTSHPDVLPALRDGVAMLFSEVPELGGVFTITMSENLTHCRSRGDLITTCPRCSARDPAEFPAEVNAAIAEGAHSAKADADVIAWTWGWSPEWDLQAVERLPNDVTLMCVSETGVPTDAMGVKGKVLDYSISKVGPGSPALKLWKKAHECGLPTAAKVQVNNTWECSAVPYLPVLDLVERHLDGLKSAGVSNLMVSWTLGGYPGGNMDLIDKTKEQIALDRFGPAAASLVLDAWSRFSQAFAEFPLNSIAQLYLAPQNYGPMNLLFPEPSGYSATMLGFPYDDLDAWRGKHYPEDVFEEQFRKLSEGWADGLTVLREAKPCVPDALQHNMADLWTVSEAAYCHFCSTYLQIRFIRLRSTGETESILRILDEEIELAKRLLHSAKRDSRIGFEASNHYYYTENDLMEKVLNCENLKKRWS